MVLETVIIRKARADDLPEMLRIMDEALNEPTVDQEMEERLERWLPKLNDNLQFLFYVVEFGSGKLIGWCRGGKAIEVHKTVNEEMYDCEMHNIFIRPQYQGRHIGFELWKIVWNDIILSFHPKNFVVWSVDKERALHFYSTLGGVQKEKRKFDKDSVSIAFVWHDLKLYESTNFVLFK